MVKKLKRVKQVITRILGCGRGCESGNAHKIFAWNRNLLKYLMDKKEIKDTQKLLMVIKTQLQVSLK